MYGYSSYGSDLFSLLGFAGGICLSLTFIAFVAREDVAKHPGHSFGSCWQ